MSPAAVAAVLLACLTGCGSSVSGTAVIGSGSQESSGPATRVVNVVPVDSSGAAAPGYQVQPGGAQVGYCAAAPSGAAQDIVSCSPSAAGADVCWVAADRQNLLCGSDPWEKTLFSARSTDPVPQLPKVDNPTPWGLELTDGARCRVRNGGAGGGRDDGLVPAYYCEAPNEELPVLVEQDNPGNLLDRSAPMWTVRVGKVGSGNSAQPPAEQVGVRTVYFAGG